MKGSLKIFTLSLFVLIIVFFIASYVISISKKPVLTDEDRKTAPGQFIELSKGIIHYELTGSQNGETVVLIHGFTTPSFVWDYNVDELKNAGFRVLRYDHYGRGFSARPDVAYDRDLYDQELIELLQKLNIKLPVHIIGLSMGGAISVIFADRHPEMVYTVSLIAPAGFPVEQSFAIKLAKTPIIGEYIMAVVGDRVVLSGVKKAFVHPDKLPEYENKFKVQMQYKGFNEALLSTMRYMHMDQLKDAYQRLGKQNKRVLLIWGRKDMILPFSKSKDAKAAIPNVEFHSIENGGHTVNYENPEIVNPILVKFLKNK
ncbi:MAG: alpha/beta hydrolase [Deltaproteobacteria bacterium]|nr:alpha/beta hydrolase [Deltaproteobacteria bacterium]